MIIKTFDQSIILRNFLSYRTVCLLVCIWGACRVVVAGHKIQYIHNNPYNTDTCKWPAGCYIYVNKLVFVTSQKQ